MVFIRLNLICKRFTFLADKFCIRVIFIEIFSHIDVAYNIINFRNITEPYLGK